MSLSSTPLWSEEQREWLQALGHDVLELASTAPVPAPQVGDAGVGSEAFSAPTVQAPSQSPLTPPDTPLLRALARAAGRSPQDAELLAMLPDLSVLRGNPDARSALPGI